MNVQPFKDQIDIELTKRDAKEYAAENGLPDDIPTFLAVPDCDCGLGLDDSTATLKCPTCGLPARQERI